MDKKSIDLNATECLVKQKGWGETIVTNLCSGEVSIIPWTIGDWGNAALMVAVGFVIFCLVLIICLLLGSFIKGVFCD